MVHADPIALYQRIMDVGPELWTNISAANYPGFAGANRARVEMFAQLRQIFNLKPLVNGFEVGEGGNATLSDSEVSALYVGFQEWCDLVKKNSKTPATTAPPSPAPSPPTSPNGQPTTSTLASGSTASAPSTATPVPSPSGPELPSASSPPA